jgi:sterol desaturase/sphingolipid hydroxylase (fatty acid hydroxylase superfamily)
MFAPLWWATGFMIASAISTGLMIGYLWYVTVHHCNHHANPRHNTYLYWAKHRHALHHYCGETRNFGVITDFWDRLFGTELQR